MLGVNRRGQVTIYVALVDDHTLVRQTIAAYLDVQPDIDVACQTGRLDDAMRVVPEFLRTYAAHPRVLVADLALPDGSGFTLLSAVRALDPDLGIVVLTMRDDGEAIVQALEAGASAHLPKTADAEDILAAVRAAARAPRTFSAAGLVEALNARREAPTHLLSPRETEVLRLLAQGQSIEHVARTLTMAPSTAKTHVGKIYDKLGVHNRAGAVMAGVKLGIVASGTAVTH